MLKLEAITAGYHKEKIVQSINMEFHSGEITAIIGPNGSGKTTLIKSIVDLCDIYDGKVCLNGKSRGEIGAKEFAKKISYLPQRQSGGSITVSRLVLHGRFPYLTYPRQYKKEDYEHCHKAMEKMGILPIKDKKIESLSGGQRQKAYIAMALAGEMDVFLFDEPTTFLDIKYQLELLNIMEELKEQNKTVITILHDLNYAMQIADKVVVMNQGEAVFHGEPNELMKSNIIDKIFQVKSKRITDEEGKQFLIFAPNL